MTADAKIAHGEVLIRAMLKAASDKRLAPEDRAEAKRLAGILRKIQVHAEHEAGRALAQPDDE